MSTMLLMKSMIYANALNNSKKIKKRRTEKPAVDKKICMIKCRACFKEKGKIKIFNNVQHPNISNEILSFTGVLIDKSDKYSKLLCQSCFDLLNGCILFRDMCQKTNKQYTQCTVVKKECEEYDEKPKLIIKRLESQDEVDISFSIPSPEVETWYYCEFCSEGFHASNLYYKHLATCNKINENNGDLTEKKVKTQYLCDVCGKICCSHANLAAHKSIHKNIFPFKCDVCPYRGRTIDLLKVHKRSHLKDKPFKCTQCPKATTTSSNLAKHMRHVHSTARPHKCTYCDKAFSYQHDLKRHIKDIHLRQGTVECDICLKKFNTKKILQGHRSKIHKIKGERQGRLPAYLQQSEN